MDDQLAGSKKQDKTTKPNDQSIDDTKSAKKRTKPPKNYPQHSIETSLTIPKTIADNNAGNPWSSEQIATSLQTGARSSNFYYLTAASRDYGFTTGTSRSKSIELTALGRKLIYPENKDQEYASLLQSFYNIDIFKKIHEYYKSGALPEKKHLYNTFQETFKIHPDYHEEFYEIYTANLKYLNQKSTSTTTASTFQKNAEHPLTAIGKSSKKELFVIMPFSEKTSEYPAGYFDEVFNSLIVPAAADAGYTAKTANKNGSDIIHKTIISSIYNSDIILADLTEHNPNVLFELGLAIAFNKKVAIIRAKGTRAIFDVDNSMRVFDYSANLWKSTLEMDVGKLSNHIISTVESDDKSYLDIFLNN